MKYWLWIIFLAGMSAEVVSAASPVENKGSSAVISEATAHDRLLSIRISGEEGIAVGENGRIMVSRDGGVSWTEEKAPTDLELMSVALSGRRAIAVGQMGLVLIRDGGGEWREIESGTPERLLQVDMNDDGIAIIVGAFGVLLKSTDFGSSWKSIAPDWKSLYNAPKTEPISYDDFSVPVDAPSNYIVKILDNENVVIGGEYGAILRSTDGGKTWAMVYRHPVASGVVAPSIFGMEIRKDGVGFAVGQSGIVLKTTDFGQTWKARETPVDRSFFGVASNQHGGVTIVGMRAGLYSSNDGETWKNLNDLDLDINWYSDIVSSAEGQSQEFLAVGHSGRIIRLVP